VAGTVGYAIWLIHSSGAYAPTWLGPVAAGVAVASLLLLTAAAAAWRRRWLLGTALILCTAAVLVIPASGAVLIASSHQGYENSAFESTKTTAMYNSLSGLSSGKAASAILPIFEKLQGGSPYVMAVYTSAVASIFIAASGKEFLPIGGFTGSTPEPSISQLEGMIRAGKFHLVLLTGEHDLRLMWIAHHCQHLGPGGGATGLFTCSPGDAPVSQS
jgi:hypothetical protein